MVDMNPIFATGIVSAGKDLIQNLSAPSSKPNLIPAGKFSAELSKAESSKELSASTLRDDFLKIDQVKDKELIKSEPKKIIPRPKEDEDIDSDYKYQSIKGFLCPILSNYLHYYVKTT